MDSNLSPPNSPCSSQSSRFSPCPVMNRTPSVPTSPLDKSTSFDSDDLLTTENDEASESEKDSDKALLSPERVQILNFNKLKRKVC
jgi:hypothetical protein